MMNGMIRRAIRVGYHPKIDQTIKKIQAKRTAAAATVWQDLDVFPQYGHAASADELNYHDPKVGNDDDSLTPQVPHVLVSETPRAIHFGGGQQVSQEEGSASSSLVEEGKNLRRSLRGSLRKKGVVPKTLRRSLQGLRGSLKLITATASRVGEDPNENDDEADWFLADVSHIIDDEEGAVDHNNVPPKKQNDDDRQDGNYCHTEDQGHLVEDDDIMFELDL